MLIRKKSIDEVEVSNLPEPLLTADELDLLEQGVKLFNQGRFWEAHEAWEEVWRRRPEDSRIFFQGIIQAAAGFHRLFEKPHAGGAARNLGKAILKLNLFPPVFLGIDVGALRDAIVVAQSRGVTAANTGFEELRPKLVFRKDLIDRQDGRHTRRPPTTRESR